MKYDFSTLIDRRNTSAIKLERLEPLFGNPDALPMWVADMDFATPPFIIQRLMDRLNHPILGYTIADDEFINAITGWQKERHGWDVEASWVVLAPGIIAGLNHAIQAFTQPGDKVLIQPPVYHPFFHATNNNDRQLIKNPLIYKDNYYTIDFDRFEQEMKQDVKLFILCNPHNPVGRVWTRDELTRMAEIALKYNVTVIADEIHSDLVYKPHKHIPFATLSPEIANRTITFASASKTFNIAGLNTAYGIISNAQFMEQYTAQVDRNGTSHGNILGFEAIKAAYTPQGKEWLSQVLEYIEENIRFATDFIKTNIPKITVAKPQGTYLLWLNFREFGMDHPQLVNTMVHQAGIAFNDGKMFGEDGMGFFRMNMATPKENIQEALKRLHKVFGNL